MYVLHLLCTYYTCTSRDLRRYVLDLLCKSRPGRTWMRRGVLHFLVAPSTLCQLGSPPPPPPQPFPHALLPHHHELPTLAALYIQIHRYTAIRYPKGGATAEVLYTQPHTYTHTHTHTHTNTCIYISDTSSGQIYIYINKTT